MGVQERGLQDGGNIPSNQPLKPQTLKGSQWAAMSKISPLGQIRSLDFERPRYSTASPNKSPPSILSWLLLARLCRANLWALRSFIRSQRLNRSEQSQSWDLRSMFKINPFCPHAGLKLNTWLVVAFETLFRIEYLEMITVFSFEDGAAMSTGDTTRTSGNTTIAPSAGDILFIQPGPP